MKAKFLWYAAGFLTSMVVFIIIELPKIIPPSNAQLLISKWGIAEDPGKNLLLLTIKDANHTIAVGVERNPETGYVKEIGITQHPEENGIWNFAYKAKGPSGFPTCYYGSPSGGMVWRNLNADCFFDQRINYVEKTMEINVDGTWVTGTCRDIAETTKRVQTQNGEFVFDGKNGRWEKVGTK